ncbi:radical SAM protein [Methanococcus voltae]|uniref:FeMo cofactor biosynthesis protein NifB n=2 Tax=Methanococcus voltae TaxID=2188 RepID=A0A8J7RN15_METVO|nr:radical SAM protein [Methanococcus voltae]MBP2173053.1 nitrogen fixation protein NifB [Methanococcus voltae]MBP2201891.1 nitrogen fixation protein NifB [Methanococcus voltae]MCS3922056.1 nitrogen fixation protein NifB [Methanococcus voltae PS]
MNQKMSKFAHITKVHPCYNEKLHDKIGRVHLPVAPKCNIACRYCKRCLGAESLCEERPGVAHHIMKPAEVEDYLSDLFKKMPNIKVIGIAGPGDSLFNKETFETLEILQDKFPEMVRCLSTNGLLLPKYAKKLADLGVKTVTVTVNAVDPKIQAQMCDWIYYEGKVLKGEEGAKVLIENQLEGVKKAYDYDLAVKINTVLVPEINMNHIVDIAKTYADYAFVQNIIPLIPMYKMENLRRPDCGEISGVRDSAEEFMTQFRACQQCRADAAGLLGEKKHMEQTKGKNLDIYDLKHFSH